LRRNLRSLGAPSIIKALKKFLSREKISETVWIIESSSVGESHPHALPEPNVNLSALPTLIDQEKEARGGQLPGSYLIMTISYVQSQGAKMPWYSFSLRIQASLLFVVPRSGGTASK
jgi:hypothetical protein